VPAYPENIPSSCLIIHILLLTYSMQHSPSWVANRFSISQEITHILLNPKVHYLIHKCPPPVHILSQLDQIHTQHPTSWRSILILFLQLHQWPLTLKFPYQNPVYASPLPKHATCTAHLILLDFITRTILGEQYRSLSSSLCSFLHSPVTSSILDQIFSTPFSNTLSLRSTLKVSDQV